jgi:hypothetical protein
MIKLKDIYSNDYLNECVAVHKVLDDGCVCLAKNRDRTYNTNMTIIRELVDDTEIVYIHDEDTDWSEGLNEHGIGIVNTALLVNRDENEKKIAKKTGQPSADGKKIRVALAKPKLSEAIKSLMYYKGTDELDVGVKGHTFIANPKHSFSIEMTSKHLPIVKRLNKKYDHIRTNHGYSYPDSGYTKGMDYTSSKMRHTISHKELKGVKNDYEILNRLSKHYSNVPSWASPYRDTNKLSTTSQVLMNLGELKLILRLDKKKGEWSGIIDRTPDWYKPKIIIQTEYTKYKS